MSKFRRSARFARRDECVSQLDRHDRAKIMADAERLEARTKAKGKKSGDLGQSGLRVLRCLLFDFHNPSSGLCDPSYAGICARTGFCRQCVADALKRLEDAGIITIIRRIKRSGWRVVTATNAYLFNVNNPETLLRLEDRRNPPVHLSYPYKRPSPLLSVPMSNALKALQERVAASEAGS